jgi:hypothetical protein
MNDQIVLFDTDGSDKVDVNDLRKLDKEDLVLAVLAHDVKPVKIVAIDRQVAFFFKNNDVDDIMMKMLANIPIPVDFHKVARALELWRNAIITMKVKRDKRSL